MQIRIEAQLNVRVRWDEVAGVYVSYAPALGIYSQGKTPDHAIQAIEGAMRMYLITALEEDKIGGVLKRLGEVVAAGMGPEPRQYINVVLAQMPAHCLMLGTRPIKTASARSRVKAVPLETVQG